MLYAYATTGTALVPLAPQADLSAAIWVDLYRPLGSQATAVAALDYEIPTLADMEEIELSNRLYMDRGTAYMTAVLPGQLPEGGSAAMPVTFILNARRLVTVRHHAPRPFETFPRRADRGSTGCDTPERVFLGLVEEIVGRLADLSEGVGKVLDRIAGRVLSRDATSETEFLQDALVTIGQQAELLGHVRMGLLSLDRILVYHAAVTPRDQAPRGLAKGIQRDIQALEVHADFLTSRIGMTIDATMGMIGLQQNERVRILSVVTALFLPPTLIASIYGMNFRVIPGLEWSMGMPMALGMMAASVAGVLALLRWKNWI
ncbi:magnesium transporter CorA family protein [Paracoccus yeei]|uniref:Magnesium transporter n=2 Tax=Paracoccus TaxID=265 RepID=A0A386UNK1_9RHOB|nr:magnesium transporter CorA family protein [Paracoccus yeei]AYF01949.1 magnesium transporter [Paracoccus yeei]OWJ95270.1 magnesium transporter [Paracoccus yeei]